LSLPASAQATIELKNLAVSRVTQDSAVIVIKTSAATRVTVEYGPALGSYPSTGTEADSNPSTRHEVRLDGLAGMGTVYYRVTATDGSDPGNQLVHDGPGLSFRPARPSGHPVRYGVLGDTQSDAVGCVEPPPTVVDLILGQMVAEDLDLALLVGDSIYSHGGQTWPGYPVYDIDSLAMVRARYDALFSSTMPLTSRTPLYMVVGNHEEIGLANARTAFEEEFTLPENGGSDGYAEEYYSFDNGDTHFIVLCTECPQADDGRGQVTGEQLAWLQDDLSRTRMPWVVVSLHRPVWDALTAVGNEEDLVNWEELHDLFRDNGVDLVFEGHSHVYSRQEHDGVAYIETGSTGQNTFAPWAAWRCLLDLPGDPYSCRPEHVTVDATAARLEVTATRVGVDYSEQTPYQRCDSPPPPESPSGYYRTFELTGAEAVLDSFTLQKELRAQTVTISPSGEGCAAIGLWDPDASACRLTDNLYFGPVDGIALGPGVTLDGDGYRLIGDGDHGAQHSGVLIDADGATVKDLGVEGFHTGIRVMNGAGNSIIGNTVRFNRHGVFMDGSSATAVRGNTVTDNVDAGIDSWAATGGDISRNVISASSPAHHVSGGLRLAGDAVTPSSGNRVVNNSFLGNPVQAYVHDDAVDNLFSLPAPRGGNYWSGWQAPDSDEDGFVDAAYSFSGGRDDLPWATQGEWERPALALRLKRAYWEDYAAYQSRELSLDYRITNELNPASAIEVVGFTSTNGVDVQTGLPASLGGLPESGATDYTVTCVVPPGVSFFRITTYVTAQGPGGRLFMYPGPYAGS